MSDEPRVWVLTNGHPGNTTQAVGLAERLGWPYTLKELSFSALDDMFPHILIKAPPIALRRASRPLLVPPWPDLAIGVGRSVIPVMRWIGKRSSRQTHLIQLGRTGGLFPDFFDLAVVPAYCPHRPHDRILETLTPINRVTEDHLIRAGQHMPMLLADVPRPRVVLLVGGQTAHHRLDGHIARQMGIDTHTFAEQQRGGACAVTSRRTGPEIISALRTSLGNTRVQTWEPNQPSNLYLACLAQADILIVTCDSESMIAEAVATSKPVYIYQLPLREGSLKSRLKARVFERALQENEANLNCFSKRFISFVCGQISRSGMLGSPRNLPYMHQILRQKGVVKFFGEPFVEKNRAPLDEGARVAAYVKSLVKEGTPQIRD